MKGLMIKVLLTAPVANTDAVFRIKAVNKGRNNISRDTNNILHYTVTDPLSGGSLSCSNTGCLFAEAFDFQYLDFNYLQNIHPDVS
jgi:hypothetical protein